MPAVAASAVVVTGVNVNDGFSLAVWVGDGGGSAAVSSSLSSSSSSSRRLTMYSKLEYRLADKSTHE